MSTGAHETARTPDFADVPEAPRSDDPALLARLGLALEDAGFRAERIAELLGTEAAEALARDQAVPALRVLRRLEAAAETAPSADRRLAVLVELLLARPVGSGDLEAALPGIRVQDLEHLRLVEAAHGQVCSLVDLDVHQADDGFHLWIASDHSAFQRPGAPLRRHRCAPICPCSCSRARTTR